MSSEIEKSTVYVETTVIGHIAGELQIDPITAGRQAVSRKWWETAAERYRLFVSDLVVDECTDGDPIPAAERLTLLEPLETLDGAEEIDQLAKLLIAGHAVPASEARDATHISFAAVYGIEYLVSWNFKHIVNSSTRPKIEEVCRRAGFRAPKLCTPEELLEAFDVV